MIRITFIALLMILASCGPEKEKVVDLSDNIPKSTRNYDDVDTVATEDPNAAALEKFQGWNPEVKAIRILKRRSFLQRFQPDKAEKYVWYLESGDSLEYERMVFPDSVRTKSAFYNWLDRTGMSYYGAQENIQREPFALLYTDTVLLRLSGKLDFSFWENLFEEQEWIGEGDLWMKQRKYSNVHWYILKENTLTELTDP